MPARDYRDILSGIVLILIGTFATVHALNTLSIGAISNMGPGMFPAALGVALAGLGILILIPAIFRAGEKLSVDVRSLLAICLAILAFTVMVRPFGLIPAVIVLTLIVSRADSKLSPIGTVILAVCLAVSATLVFRAGLGMPIATIAWPW